MPDAARYAFVPRVLRPDAAAHYLGVGLSTFRAEVAPQLKRVRVTAGVAGYTREELDRYVDARAGAEDAAAPVPNPWHEGTNG